MLAVESAPAAGAGPAEKMVVIPEHEYLRLCNEKGYWESMHGRTAEREAKLKAEVESLSAQVRDLEKRLYGPKSERSAGKGKGKGKETGAKSPGAGRPRGQQKGSRGHGRIDRSHLESQEEFADLAEDQKQCPQCGLGLEPFPGTEDSEVVEVEVRAYKRLIRRKRYRPSCRCGVLPGILTAPAPARLFPKCTLGISVWVDVLLGKYLFQCPTRRLLQDLESRGLEIAPGTVGWGLKKAAGLFEPVVHALRNEQLSEDLWQADETGWKVFAPLEGTQGHGWHLWVFLSACAVVYQIAPSRAAAVAAAYFGEASGRLVSDRYSAYKKLAKDSQGRIESCFCWVHVRRDFLAVALGWPKQAQWAQGWLDRIAELYRLNRRRLEALGRPRPFAQKDRRLRAALERMRREYEARLLDDALHPACAKPLKSLRRHWAGLTVFASRPEVPMDNNASERALRGPVTGRKNYWGSGSLWSAALAADAFTVLYTCQRAKLNPRLWLTDYLQACAANGGRPPQDISPFLPWEMGPARKAQLQGPPPPQDSS